MTKRILIQLDSDSQPSSFDSVVAIDSGVDHLLKYGQVKLSAVVPLCMAPCSHVVEMISGIQQYSWVDPM